MKVARHSRLVPQAPSAQASRPTGAGAPTHTAKATARGHSTKDTFDRLDRDHDGRIQVGDLVGGSKPPPSHPGVLRGDANHDGAVSRREFKSVEKHLPDAKKASSSHPSEARAMNTTFTMPRNQSATFRTHPSGLVLGRVQEGDKFVASHQKGNWVYGHVEGHPDRKGWVLRNSLPDKNDKQGGHTLQRESTPHERAEGTRHSEDLRKKAGLDYTTGRDKKAMQYMQQGLHVSEGKVGYTTPVRPRNPTQPITVYANYPCTDANVLRNREGKRVQLPAGQDVKFRYTPDGKNAVVLLGSSKAGQGTWGIVPMEQLDIPQGTIGSTPPQRPLRHTTSG